MTGNLQLNYRLVIHNLVAINEILIRFSQLDTNW